MSVVIYKHRNCYCCVATISIADSSVDSDALILFSGIMLSQGFRNPKSEFNYYLQTMDTKSILTIRYLTLICCFGQLNPIIN